MANQQGNLSINSENIFPIIKKWLYSDHDIFFRELISNGCDAITKLKKLDMMGEYQIPDDTEFKVRVVVNDKDKTLKFIDNGLGMTAEEVEEYICQIAFSGAEAFLAQYKDKTNEDQIIGHFGLGFYSAFMVADRVEIDTLSYKDGAKAVHWDCDGGTTYEMNDSDKNTVGTEITLYLNEDSVEFCNEYRAREVIEKYCSFMPISIFLENETAEPQYETIPEEEVTEKDTVIETVVEPEETEEKENEDGRENPDRLDHRRFESLVHLSLSSSDRLKVALIKTIISPNDGSKKQPHPGKMVRNLSHLQAKKTPCLKNRIARPASTAPSAAWTGLFPKKKPMKSSAGRMKRLSASRIPMGHRTCSP